MSDENEARGACTSSKSSSTASRSSRSVLVNDTMMYTHPDDIQDWSEDMRDWPEIRGPDIVYYLVQTKACDLREVRAYKSLESYNYLQSGWVGKVLSHKLNDDIVLLKCEVTPSQAVSSRPHQVWVSAQSTGEVLRAGCTCMAGQARVCSHVGAVLWKVDCAVSRGFTGRACTDAAAMWNRGTKRNVEPSTLDHINFKRTTVELEVQAVSRPIQPPLSVEEIKKMHQESGYPELFTSPGTQLYATFNAAPRQLRRPSEKAAPHGSHEAISDLPASCLRCCAFYDKFVNLSAKATAALEEETRGQNSPLWAMARCLRLTASNIKKVPKKSSTPSTKAVNAIISPTFSGNAATKHGQKYEAVARTQFERKTGHSVTQCGTILCADMPWLSASPDGLLETAPAILEIKCPHVMDCLELVRSGRHDVKEKDGKYILSENGPNGYYAQVQFQMLCTGRDLCYFYMWSVQTEIVVEVPFSPTFVNSSLPRLQKFYFCHLLPELETRHVSGQLIISAEYSRLCELQV